MNIETKFDYGQTVWFLYNNEPRDGYISWIDISIGEREANILYHVASLGRVDLFPYGVGGRVLFESRQQLMESL